MTENSTFSHSNNDDSIIDIFKEWHALWVKHDK